MWTRILQSWSGLSQREHRLLAVMFALALPAAIVFLGVLPLLEGREKARAALSEARALDAWVNAQSKIYRAAQQERRGAQISERQNRPPLGIAGLEKSLVAAGLRRNVKELANRSEGAVTLSFDEVRFSSLTDWLNNVSPIWGYQLASFSFDRGDLPDSVSASFTLEVAQ
jgi:type II secretory pathway component PulM